MTTEPRRRRRWTSRVRAVPRRELAWLAGAMLVGLGVRLLYVHLTRDHALLNDENEYDLQGRFIEMGRVLWSSTPFGNPHPSLWKAPGYPLWVGGWYRLIGGPSPDTVLAVQCLLGPLTIGLTWALGRRLFSSSVGLAAAWVVALYPNAWQYEVRLFSEAFAVPLCVLLLLLVLGRAPTPRRAMATGAVLGVSLLVRPSSAFLMVGVVAAFIVAVGWRRGALLASVTAAVALLIVAPWTYRNYHLEGGFVPISVQDAAGYGTFNDDAANDEDHPYAWRPGPSRDRELFARGRVSPLTDTQLRAELNRRTRQYIKHNPESVPLAFFWNGLSRLWDIRRPSEVLGEVPFEGRTRVVTGIGLYMYWVLLALALAALWRERRRRALLLPVLALAVAAAVAFTPDAGTRYRAPLEPLIAVLACSTVVGIHRRRAGPAEPHESPAAASASSRV